MHKNLLRWHDHDVIEVDEGWLKVESNNEFKTICYLNPIVA
jgi:hypothetical protein